MKFELTCCEVAKHKRARRTAEPTPPPVEPSVETYNDNRDQGQSINETPGNIQGLADALNKAANINQVKLFNVHSTFHTELLFRGLRKTYKHKIRKRVQDFTRMRRFFRLEYVVVREAAL